MSDTQDRPHLTVEDGGTTSDPADLVRSGVGHPARHDEATDDSADLPTDRQVATATDTGEPTQPTTTQDEPAERPTARTDRPEATDRPAQGDLSALAGADLGHVFDQTNGVIERADGDSDGTRESDVLSAAERDAVDGDGIDAGAHGDPEQPESRRIGD